MKIEELDRLLESVRCRLARRLRDIRLELREDGVVLLGRASCYFDKAMAQHEVLKVVHSVRLINAIEVSP
jgi:hypothetical protein